MVETLDHSLQDNQELREKFSQVKAVIFDMDGLMIDSEPFHCLAYDKVFRQYGKELTEAENNAHYVGISDKDASLDMVSRYELPITPEELVHQKQLAYLEYLQQITPQPGLKELLSDLKSHNFKTAIASSSMLREIEAVIKTLNISEYFDTYCSAQEVEYGKPAPDVFLYAAKKLNIEPENCLVLEDATSGITAAGKAGMLSIAIPSRETISKDFSEATLKLSSLKEVFAFLSSNPSSATNY